MKKLPKGMSIETSLHISYLHCPDAVRNRIQEHHAFGNDITLNWYSEFNSNNVTMQDLVDYHQDQVAQDNFAADKSFDEFIEQYGLEIEKWLVDSKVDLSGVSSILIDICW